MRNIPEEVKQSIVDIFPKESTLAIIVFGSYGTDRQTLGSDIDIAWSSIDDVKRDFGSCLYDYLLAC